MKNKLEVISKIVDECSKDQLTNVFDSIADLLATSTKAEMISHCFNTELGGSGFNTYTSPDKTMVLINDETMCKVVDFFNSKGYQPYITTEQIDRVKTISKLAEDNKVSILWDQSGLRKKYYYFKQYRFNGINLYNTLNINAINAAAAATSGFGAATLSMAGVVALSWSGSMFLSTAENYIPNTMPRFKLAVSGLKYGIAFLIRCVEWTSNQIISFAENIITGHTLPTNVTEVYGFNRGPKLKELKKLKNPVSDWIIKRLNK